MPIRRPASLATVLLTLLAACQPQGATSPGPTEGSGPTPLPSLPPTPYESPSAIPSVSPAPSAWVMPTPSPVVGSLAWSRTTSIPIARAEHTATRLADGRVLVVGGRHISFDRSANLSDETLDSVLIFDPAKEVWFKAASLHEPRNDHMALLLHDGRVLIAGGFTPNAKDYSARTLELYDPSTDRWTVLTTPMPAYIGSITLLADGRVLVIGSAGYGLASPHRDRQSYAVFDPTGLTWSAVRPTDTIVAYTTTLLLPDGRVLAAGGAYATGDGPPPASHLAAVFDPSNQTWTALPPMEHEHLGFGFGLLPDGRVLVADNDAEIFDPASARWSVTGQPAGPWFLPIGTSLADGRYLVVGQQGSSDSRGIAELYDPATSAWRDAGAFPETSSLTATLLADGRVFVVGGLITCYAGTGCHDDTLSADAYFFDPAELP